MVDDRVRRLEAQARMGLTLVHKDAERSMNICWAHRRGSPTAGCRQMYSPSGCMSHVEQLSCS
jgi:hypothetical protein